MGTAGAKTAQPFLRTDQYFSSKGTKHLVELLVNSFTHSSGTPCNTQPYTVDVCVWSGEFKGHKSYCRGDRREIWEHEEVLVCVYLRDLSWLRADSIRTSPFFLR